MFIEEGLESTDVDEILAVRGVAKDLVIKDIASLQNFLVAENGKFSIDKIDGKKAQELDKKMGKSYRIFFKLHWWYWAFRSEAHSQAEKQAFENSEETYSAVKKEYIAVKSDYMQYKENLTLSIDEKRLSVLKVPNHLKT